VPTTDRDRESQAIGTEECLRLLASTGIGRLAYTEAALPAIRPVSFRIREDDVLIPASRGSRLVRAIRGAVVAFQVDSYDGTARPGWSVTVVGPSRVITGGSSEAPGACLIAVQLGLVRGWRTTLGIGTPDAAHLVDGTPA
jgi:uncharacterized protein